MSIVNISLILVSVLDLGLALLIWLRNPKNKINISFALTILFLATWTFSISMFRESTTVLDAWIWTWVEQSSGVLIPIPFLLFATYFPYQDVRWSTVKKMLILISTILVLFVVYIPGVWTEEVILIKSNNERPLNRLGMGYVGIHFITFFTLAYINLIKKFLNNKGFIRDQLKYIAFSTLVTVIVGSFFGVIMPLFLGRLGYYWIGAYSSIVMGVAIVYFAFYYKKI